MSQTTNNKDRERENAHTRYIQIAHDCRDKLIETLAHMRASQVDPRAVFINEQNGHSQRTNTIHRAMNTAVLSYYDHFVPYEDKLEDYWNEEIDTVRIGEQSEVVSLDNLGVWRGYQVRVTREKQGELESGGEETTVNRAWLPVESAGMVQNQLDRCLVELGWAASTELKVEMDPDPI